MATANKTTETKKEFTLEQAFALWKKQGNNGTNYLSGYNLIGFYNIKKKNPKEPDLRIYRKTEEGIEKEEYCSMWVNATESGKKYLTGKLGEKRLVGFLYTGDNEKRPYLSVYFSEDKPEQKPEKKKKSKKPEFVDLKDTEDTELPF